MKEIADRLPDAPIVRRPGQINAMDNEDFAKLIKDSGRKQIIIRYSRLPLQPSPIV